MLRITNGEQILTVSKGAFREIYAPAGWEEYEETPLMPPLGLAKVSMESGGSNTPAGNEEPPEDAKNAPSEEETLENMSEVELKQYASLLGIKTKTLKTREELMKAIKAHKE